MKLENDSKQYRKISKRQNDTTLHKGRIKPSELAKKVLLKGESIQEFEELRAQILSDMSPQSKIDNILCEKIIITQWKIRRASEIERNLLNAENEITFDEKHPNSWDPPGRKRITNIDKVRMQSPEVQNIVNYQIEMEKVLQKLFSRLRSEQRLRQTGKKPEK